LLETGLKPACIWYLAEALISSRSIRSSIFSVNGKPYIKALVGVE
jgi:hypothetical protein